MSPVLTRPGRPSTTRSPRTRVILVVGGLAIAVLLLLQGIALLVRGPSFVPRVSVENATPYLVDVEVASPGDAGFVGLGAASPRARMDVGEVIDQGDRWVFHFTAGRFDGGQVTLTRPVLERQGWRVQVPPDLAARLAAAGAAPFPS
jgi:hypothetical protein